MNRYDQIPYPSYPYAASHPDRLYSIARLFGLTPCVPDKARILEIGCASGGNILPIASALPNSECVAVDLSKVQIDAAKALATQSKLSNIEFLCQDLTTLSGDLGKFDYIICHGVFSWIPEGLQQQLMAVTRRLLAEVGVCYISYNTLPGWYMRSAIRGMMLQHIGDRKEPRVMLAQARALLRFLVESTEHDSSPWASFLRAESKFLEKQSDDYLFHDHLEENNHPIFFQEFVRLAEANGLQFLGEANLASMWMENLPAKAAAILSELASDIVSSGQYADYINSRTFRQTLLCHESLDLNRNLKLDHIQDAWFAGQFVRRSATEACENDSQETVFDAATERTVSTADLAFKAILDRLNEMQPSALSFKSILESVNEVAEADTKQSDSDRLANFLYHLVLSGNLQLSFVKPRFTMETSERPIVSSHARTQSLTSTKVCNLRHEIVDVGEIARHVIPTLDGNADLDDISRMLDRLVHDGRLSLQCETTLDENQRHQTLRQMAEQILTQIASQALLTA